MHASWYWSEAAVAVRPLTTSGAVYAAVPTNELTAVRSRLVASLAMPEVEHCRVDRIVAPAGDHDIGRFDVAVHHAALVRVVQSVRDFGDGRADLSR